MRYWDGRSWTDSISAPKHRGNGRVAKTAVGLFVAAILGLIALGLLSGHHDGGATETATDSIPRVSPIPLTPNAEELKDLQFYDRLSRVDIGGSEAKMLAAATCLAFRQNPGTSMPSAVRQIAQQRGWTTADATVFLDATTSIYCPEYVNGS